MARWKILGCGACHGPPGDLADARADRRRDVRRRCVRGSLLRFSRDRRPPGGRSRDTGGDVALRGSRCPAGQGSGRPAGSFSVGGQLDGVAAAPASGVWAAGSSTLGNPLTVRWDGRAWKPVPAPGGDHLTSPEGGYLNDVAAVSADDAWTVGAGMFDRALIEHWDGTAWTSPAVCSNPSAPACYPAGNTSQAAATQPATSRTPPPSSTALSPAPDRPGLNHGAEGLGEFNGS